VKGIFLLLGRFLRPRQLSALKSPALADSMLQFSRRLSIHLPTPKPFHKEVPRLVSFSFFVVLFALLLAVAALLREVRLRRALERLLKRLLEIWRKKDHE
jgi:hypothetical protein